jgi:hypothetical protein
VVFDTFTNTSSQPTSTHTDKPPSRPPKHTQTHHKLLLGYNVDNERKQPHNNNKRDEHLRGSLPKRDEIWNARPTANRFGARTPRTKNDNCYNILLVTGV